jgi:hypothetical protein
MWLVHYIDQKAFLHATDIILSWWRKQFCPDQRDGLPPVNNQVVSKHGVATDPKKIDAVKHWLKQSNVSELRSFLGFCGYCRRYIAKFSEFARPLHKLTEKGKIFSWSVDCQNALPSLHSINLLWICCNPMLTDNMTEIFYFCGEQFTYSCF